MARFKNTVRIILLEGKCGPDGIEIVFKNMLMELGGVSLSDIYSLPEFPRRGLYEVVFNTTEAYRKFHRSYKANKENEVFKDVEMSFLHCDTTQVVTVQMYNTYIKAEEVARHLIKNAKEVVFLKNLTNRFGAWNGKRLFRVKFHESDLFEDGILHPQSNQISG